MNVDHTGVHQTHCCVLHGCKYCDDDCPVVNREVKQAYRCEDCCSTGIIDIPDPDHPDYDILEKYEDLLRTEVRKLRDAIRSHRDGKITDEALYLLLPESLNACP